jgi:hypothetical protein
MVSMLEIPATPRPSSDIYNKNNQSMNKKGQREHDELPYM